MKITPVAALEFKAEDLPKVEAWLEQQEIVTIETLKLTTLPIGTHLQMTICPHFSDDPHARKAFFQLLEELESVFGE